MIVKRFRPPAHKLAGVYYNGHWMPYSAFASCGNWHKVHYKKAIDYFYTMHYAKMLKTHQPNLYLKLHKGTNPKWYCFIKGIDPKSDKGKRIIVEAVKLRMRIGQ